MKSSLDHLPERKQREIERIVEIIHEEFDDALKEAKSESKRRGRIFKIILFGSYAKGTWVDEPHTMKGYRSDYDILVIVNERRFAEYEYWDRATDRLNRDAFIGAPVGLIVHSAREVNNFLHNGQYFFTDISREGVVLYELDDRELAVSKPLGPSESLRITAGHYEDRFSHSRVFLKGAKFYLEEDNLSEAAFLLHQSIEQAYTTVLLVLTNYSPNSHNLKFLRMLAEDRDRRLIDAWPRDQHRYTAWFNVINEAYVKARYSKHYEISEEALHWLIERTDQLIALVEIVCRDRLEALAELAKDHA